MSQSYTKGIPVDTDPSMAANTNLLVPSQAAVVAYVATQISTGTVNSVTATAPVASSGGPNPNISMPAANGSTDGYITSTDYNNFSNKASTNDAIAYAIALG